MKKLLLVGLLLIGMSVHAAEGGGKPSGLVASKCRTCKKYKGPEFGTRGCQCGQPAAASAAAKPTPPPVAPKSKSSSAAIAPQEPAATAASMPRVRTGGSVHTRWNPEEQTTRAERDIRAGEDAKAAQALYEAQLRAMEELYGGGASGYDSAADDATQRVIADMLAADLDAQAAQQRRVDEMTAQQVAAEEGARAYRARNAAAAADAELAQKLQQQQEFSDAIENLRVALIMSDLSEEQRALIEEQITQLEAQLLSLGL